MDQIEIYYRNGFAFTKLERNRWVGTKDASGRITVKFTPLLTAKEIKVHCNYDDLDFLQLPVDKAEFFNSPEKLITVYQKVTTRTETYEYDGMGNRTLEKLLLKREHIYEYKYYENSNRLKTNGRYAYQYDANGNLIKKGNKFKISGDTVEFVTEGEGVEYWEYSYDLLNQLEQVKKNGEVVSSYTYDPNGFRVEKVGSKGKIHYVPLLNGEVGYRKEFTSGKEYSFIYVGIQHLARVNGVIGGSGKKFYYHNDHLGSAMSVTDEDGNIVVERDFSPFGEKIKVADSEEPYPDETEDGFTGKDFDEDIGLYYYNARWYDPTVGKFITEDSVADDPNLYSYCGQNPVNAIDPTGHWNVTINWSNVLTTAISSVSPEISRLLSTLSAFRNFVGTINNIKWIYFLKFYSSMSEEDFKEYLQNNGINYDFNENNQNTFTFTNTDGQKPLNLSMFTNKAQQLLVGDQKLEYFEAMKGNIKAFLENNPGLSLEQVKGLFDSAVISADNPWGFGKNEFRYEGRGSNYNNLYGAEAIIMNGGMILGVFTRASTLPDDQRHATICEGIYDYKVGRHHQSRHNTEIGQPAPKDENGNYYTYPKQVWNKRTKKYEIVAIPIDDWRKGAYKALRLQGRIPSTKNGRLDEATGINSHYGYRTVRGSEGCQTVYGDDYTTYIDLYEWTDYGKFIVIR